MANADISNTLYIGKTKQVKLPSGKEVIIRENNGDDEGVLSNFKDSGDNTSVSKYLASIIVADLSKSKDPANPIGITFPEALDWKVNDRHYALFEARVLSLGPDFKFKYVCRDPKCKHEAHQGFTEDLKPFLFPKDTIAFEEGAKYPKPYPLGEKPEVEITLSSGKLVKFNILNGIAEKVALDMPQDTISKNAALTIRKLQLYSNAEWQTCFHFKMFSSRDMAELRAALEEHDPVWEPLLEIECPKCNLVNYVGILGSPDFFFPTGI